MTALRRYAWMAAVAAALVLSPSDGAHSGADWEAAYAGTDWEEIRRAAEGGDAEAQIRLGNMYLGDEDALVAPDEIPQDDVRAYVWLSLGVAGLSDASTDELLIARDLAIDDLRRLEERMTALQLGTAQQLIQDRREGAPQAEQPSTIREAQQLLHELGYAPGPSDGIWGPRTERAYRSYLRDAGLPDMAFSAQVLEGMREATWSAAGHAARAEQPGTGQAETSADRAGGTTETIVYDNGARYVGQTRSGKPHGRGIITWASGNRYEGAFVDGRRTGHGIYTWANGDRYEGDFVEGKRTGRGVAAWANGNRYEGDFVDNRRTGRGVFTWPNGNRYEGDFIDGKEAGRGIMTHTDGERYEGDFRDGERHGRGLLIRADGSREEVEYREGMLHGSVLTWADGRRYEGETLHGKAHGRGVMTWPNGNRYEGEFRDGERTGRGVITWSNGGRYEGGFLDGVPSGQGFLLINYNDGNRYEGDVRDRMRHGRGVFTWANGNRYQGDFVEGKRTGRGVFTWANGDRYEGNFRDGRHHGHGTFTWANSDRYEGEFRDGKQHGPGISIKADGRRFAVEFRDGKQIDSGEGSVAQGKSSSTATRQAGEARSGSEDDGAKLCQLAQKRVIPGPYRRQASGDRYDYDDAVRRALEVVRGPNYRSQMECVKEIKGNPLNPAMSAMHLLCNYPIIVGYCVTKVGPNTGGTINSVEPYEICNPENPMPEVLGPMSSSRGGEHPGWAVTGATNDYYYWAFTCEP